MEHRFNLSVLVSMAAAMLLLAIPGRIQAQYYGQGEEEVSISVDKKVRYIHDEKYYDNIDDNQQVFFDGDLLDYKITAENTSDRLLTNIAVVDQLPTNTEAVMWPGTLDSNARKVSFTIDSLNSGETKDYLIRIRIVDVDSLALAGNMKLANVVEVKANGVADQDSASIYVGQKTIPMTGDNTLILKTLFGLVFLAGALGTRRIVRGY